MKSTAIISFNEINIAEQHLNGQARDRCTAALWSIYNVLKKAKTVSMEHWHWNDTKLNILYKLGKQSVFFDADNKVLILNEGEINIKASVKKDLTKCGFTIGNKNSKTSLSYRDKDFDDVILGLKMFIDICEKCFSTETAENIFHYGDITVAFENVNIKAKEQEIKNIIAHDVGLKGTLSENVFNVISDTDRAFIYTFDEKMNELGYDFGNRLWGASSYSEVAYSKTGTKSKNMVSRLKIQHDNGKISLRFYIPNADINKKRAYIENAPEHIRKAWIFENKNCTGCNSSCSPKKYMLDGREFLKCMHYAGTFTNPNMANLTDYIALVSEFFVK